MTLLRFKPFMLVCLAMISVFTLADCKKDDDDDDSDPVSGTEPTASFSFTASELEVTFTFTGDDADDYLWEFGDGSSSTLENPTHTYASGGTYTVVLTVENDEGDDSMSQEVMVESNAQAAEPQELSFGDADGAFYAINNVSITEQAGIELQIKTGQAVAWFVNGGSEFVSVGEVSVANSKVNATLDIQDNNSYIWVEAGTTMEGFSNNGVEWSIGGGNGHGFINNIANAYPFPTTKKVAESGSSISGSSDYTLTHDGAISDADSSIFAIHGPDDSVMKTVDGSTTSVTFTAAEVSSVGSGAGILQIASYKVTNQTLGGKKYYMINESVASKNVTIE